MKRILAVVLVLMLAPVAVVGQDAIEKTDNTRYGGTTAQFLTFPAEARGAALGGSYSALVSDVSSMHWNPAGLALLPATQALFSYTPYLADTRSIWAGIGMPLRGGEWGLGVSFSNFGFGEQPVYTEANQEGTGETYSVSESAIGATLALQFSDRFSAGFTGKVILQQFAQLEGTGFAFDFGTSYHTELAGRPIRASFIMRNYGGDISVSGPELNTQVPPVDGGMGVDPTPAVLRTASFGLPTEFRVGIAYDVLAGESQRITLLSEFSQPTDTDPGFSVAAEYGLRLLTGVSAQLRGSFAYLADNDGDEVSEEFKRNAFASSLSSSLDGLALGGGLHWEFDEFRGVGVDYAYRRMDPLSAVHQFSIRVSW